MCELMLQEIQAAMKTSKERKGKRVDAPTNCNGSIGSVGVNKTAKRNCAQGRKVTGRTSDVDSTFFELNYHLECHFILFIGKSNSVHIGCLSNFF